MARILIVDDDAANALLMQKMLERHGHETRIAQNASDAIQLGSSFAPEVVLTDISLPGSDGYELARILKEQLANKPRIIAVSGYSQDDDPRSALLDGFLVKPVGFDVLLQAIDPAILPS